MLEMVCPRCGGPAIKQNATEISCGLCGDFVHGFEEQLELRSGRSLLDQFPDPTPEQKRLNLKCSEDEAQGFPSQLVSIRLPREFELADHCDFEVTVGRALEFFFGFLEVYEAIPEVPSTLHGEPKNYHLLSSHAYRLEKLAEQSELDQQQLSELALELYTMSENSRDED